MMLTFSITDCEDLLLAAIMADVNLNSDDTQSGTLSFGAAKNNDTYREVFELQEPGSQPEGM